MIGIARFARTLALIALLLCLAIALLLCLATAHLARAATDDDNHQPDENDDAPHPRPATPPGSPPAHSLPQVREHQLDPDDGLHQQQSWMLSDYTPFGLFPDVGRFYVRRWTSATTSWISPNCPASSLPSPPSRYGPSACACPGSSRQSESVYGQMEIEHMWTWCADWRDLEGRDTSFHRLFVPDIWNGQGPCPRFEQLSVLHRMPSRLVQAGDWFRIDPIPRAAMEAQEDLDNELIPALFPNRDHLPPLDRTVFQGAVSKRMLTEAWASWVQSLLARRSWIVMELVWNLAHSWISAGRADLWERIRASRYFGAGPLGAWFTHTLASAGTIRRLLRLGVPVYYRWDEVEHGSRPELADLRPRPPPRDDTQGVVMPPLSPHRGGRVDRYYHRYSHRSPVRSAYATTMDGRPIHVSREEMAHLTDVDPAARPPPLRFPDLGRTESPAAGPSQRRARSNRRSQASSTSRAEVDSASQASVPSKKGSLASRLSSPPPNTRQPPAPATPRSAATTWEFVFSETHERAVSLYAAAVERGKLPHHEDRVAWAVNQGMIFNTGTERNLETEDAMDTDSALDIIMTQDTEAHYVAPDLTIAESTPVENRYAQWERGVRAILARPHARAALARGGLVARIAREFGLTVDDALAGPTAAAHEIPNERTVEVAGGRSLVDDYLSDSEVAVLLGHVGIRDDSLWPDEATFRSNGWEGVWTEWHDAWFADALQVLRSPGFCATSKRDQWRNAMRLLRHRSHGGGPPRNV